MDTSELLSQFTAPQPEFKPQAQISITKKVHLDLFDKDCDVEKVFDRNYRYTEIDGTRHVNYAGDSYVIDENGNVRMPDPADPAQTAEFNSAHKAYEYPTTEEVQERFREMDHQDMMKFLEENPAHAEAAKAYGSPEEYLRSQDYANLTAEPVSIQQGKLTIGPDNPYGIDIDSGRSVLSY